jgi:hypothetical protein
MHTVYTAELLSHLHASSVWAMGTHLLFWPYLVTTTASLPVFDNLLLIVFRSEICLAEVLCGALHEQTNDKTEESENGAENLNDENLDEAAGLLGCMHTRWDWDTHREGSAASARAALLPLIPTDTPQMRLHMPTVRPAQKRAYPVK